MCCPPGRCCQIVFEKLTFLIHNMPDSLCLTVSSGFYGNEGSVSPALLVMGGVHGIEVTDLCRGMLWVARGVTQGQG